MFSIISMPFLRLFLGRTAALLYLTISYAYAFQLQGIVYKTTVHPKSTIQSKKEYANRDTLQYTLSSYKTSTASPSSICFSNLNFNRLNQQERKFCFSLNFHSNSASSSYNAYSCLDQNTVQEKKRINGRNNFLSLNPYNINNNVNFRIKRSEIKRNGVTKGNNENMGSENSFNMTEFLSSNKKKIDNLKGKIVVIKYGGHAMENDELKSDFASDVAQLMKLGIKPVVVHGGGPQIAAMLKRLNVESTFVEGLRVTDAKTLEVAEMVLSGLINKDIASRICLNGVRSIGINGKDDNTLIGSKVSRLVDGEQVSLGYVGEPKNVNTKLIEDLLEKDIVPVIAPIGISDDGLNDTLNINADTAAGCIAGALKADQLLLLTDVPGVLSKEKELYSTLNLQKIEELKADGTVYGGMIPKLEMAIYALQKGVTGGSVILDGRVSHAVIKQLLSDSAVGTFVSVI